MTLFLNSRRLLAMALIKIKIIIMDLEILVTLIICNGANNRKNHLRTRRRINLILNKWVKNNNHL